MLTGRVPFSSDSEYDLMQMQIEKAPEPPRLYSARIPQHVEQAIMRALAKRIEARFQGAAEFRVALSSALAGGAAPTQVAPAISPQQTQIIGTVAPPPRQGYAPQETRIASQGIIGSGGEVKQTRLAAEVNAPSGYALNQVPGVYQSAPMPPPGKSNLKLFIGIGAALFVVMVTAAVILFTIGKQPAASPGVPASQPAQSAVPAASPAAGAGQPSIPAQAPPQPPPQVNVARPAGDTLSGVTVPTVENANSAKLPKPARKDSSAEAAARKEKERKAAEARRLLNQ
jgi:hypothetical protein